MSWLTDFARPKIKKLKIKEIADDLWVKCPSCGNMLFTKELEKNLNVCNYCDQHLKLSADKRLEMLFDGGKYKKEAIPEVKEDPLKFKDIKKYSDRLKASKKKTGADDAIVVATGKIGGIETSVACFNFSFMGGSMGTRVGEGVVRAAEIALEKNIPLITITCSGGARMQEGVLSLMQMARTTVAIARLKEKGLPFISLLTDPTTGGVSASFAMIGDIHIAEKGCVIAFAGARVIEQTIREKLPEGFQKAEYLKEHGMVDIVVRRSELKSELVKVMSILLNKPIKTETLSIGN